jgi:hypothetical protein
MSSKTYAATIKPTAFANRRITPAINNLITSARLAQRRAAGGFLGHDAPLLQI